MRKLLARVALPVLATTALLSVAAPAASADPAYPYESKCTPTVQLTPKMQAWVCITHQGVDYGARWFWYANALVRNTSGTPMTVTLRTDIESDTAIHYGSAGSYNIANNEYAERWSPSIDSPGPHPRGRVRIDAPGYSEYMYSPAF